MINKDYLYTQIYPCSGIPVVLKENSLFLYALDSDYRSKYCVEKWKVSNLSTLFCEVEDIDADKIKIDDQIFSLHSQQKLSDFLQSTNISCLYIDVTAMSCRIIAPFLKASISLQMEVFIVYVEPLYYDIQAFKRVGLNQDLAEAVDGVNPLPGFITIFPHNEDSLFLFFLGFEGGRLSFLIQNQQPVDDKILPIIGVPGYVLKYPFESYFGNQISLLKTHGWQKVKYAEANSIVDAFVLLNKVYKKQEEKGMIIAPIGTKPHSIAAILFAIKHDNVELLYDNPKQGLHRAYGVRQAQICCVSDLIKAND